MSRIVSRSTYLVKTHKVLVCMLLVAAVLVFYRTSHVDLLGDDAHYSTRALGILDYMFGNDEFQSTPLHWFDQVPWWAHLSFHDHPLVIFIIQHFFLKIQVSIFFAKLPYALMALGTVVVTYAWVHRLWGKTVALLSAGLLILNSHFIFYGRSAFMESGVMFFISLAWYYFIRFLDDQKQWWKFGLFLGLMLEAKFTTFFLIPTFVLYLIIQRRDVLRSAKLYYAGALALLIFLPVIIYNLAMYSATGHFGLQLARLLGQNSPWHMSGVSTNPVSGLLAVPVSLARDISIPYFVVALLSAAYIFIKRREGLLLGLAFVFIILEDITIGAKDPYGIFIAPLVALAIVRLRAGLSSRFPCSALTAATSGLALFLFIFVINSQLVVHSRGPIGWLRGTSEIRNYGMVQLDNYLNKLVASDAKLTPFDPGGYLKVKDSRLHKYLLIASEEELAQRVKNAHVILFDGNSNWFARVWLFERRRFYNNIPLISLNEDHLLKQLHLDSFYFIKATEYAALDSLGFRNNAADATEQNITKLGIEPTLIYRDDGQVAFKVYHVTQSKDGKVL